MKLFDILPYWWHLWLLRKTFTMKHVSFKCVPVSFYYSLECIILAILLFHLVFVTALSFEKQVFDLWFLFM